MFKLEKFSVGEVTCFASNVSDGNMSFARSNGEDVDLNRSDFLKKFDIPLSKCVFANLDHGSKVLEINEISEPEVGDGLLTTMPGICLAVTAGDCVPIIYWNKGKRVLAISHNGWRGTLLGLTSEVLDVMKNKFGCEVKDTLIGIGPSICQKHYEVGQDVFSKIPEKYKAFAKSINDGKWLLDLWGINRMQAIDSGVLEANIEVSGICTFDDEMYFSSRRENGGGGRFIFGGMINE